MGLETEYTEHFEVFKKQEEPIVIYDRVPDSPNMNKMLLEDYKAAFQVIEHLVSIGLQKYCNIERNQSMDILNIDWRLEMSLSLNNKL
ncbi:hypothetical protein [Saccharicrinis sp. 156]|uniref:hypothetical protein n=1 Tax=Saccharicrinis sp. 156 TaxID=3417574 RepID=UPI003D330E54